MEAGLIHPSHGLPGIDPGFGQAWWQVLPSSHPPSSLTSPPYPRLLSPRMLALGLSFYQLGNTGKLSFVPPDSGVRASCWGPRYPAPLPTDWQQGLQVS